MLGVVKVAVRLSKICPHCSAAAEHTCIQDKCFIWQESKEKQWNWFHCGYLIGGIYDFKESCVEGGVKYIE